ncbi:MAG: hypothetical protein ACHP6H_03665, partial [Legionellales bacterium]
MVGKRELEWNNLPENSKKKSVVSKIFDLAAGGAKNFFLGQIESETSQAKVYHATRHLIESIKARLGQAVENAATKESIYAARLIVNKLEAALLVYESTIMN